MTFLMRLALAMTCVCGVARAQPPDYSALAAQLAATHPEYRAMRDELVAAQAAIDVAYAFPDPMLELEMMDIDSDQRMRDRSTKYTWEQLFPLWGKRGLRRAGAEAGRHAAAARAELTLAELRAMLREAFAELYAAHRATAINDEVTALLADMAVSADTRYANGLAAQQDVIKVRTELAALAGEQLLLQGEIGRASALINSLLGAPVGEKLPAPLALPDSSGFAASYARLHEELGGTPALTMAEATVRQRRAARELAARERLPDLTVGVSPVEMGGQLESWQLMLRMEVPLFGARSAEERESVAMLAGAEARYEAELRRLQAAAAQSWAVYEAARERERLFDGELRGAADINLRAALAGYQTGQVDFDTVIEAERQVRDARLQALAAAVEQQRALARFEQATGVQP